MRIIRISAKVLSIMLLVFVVSLALLLGGVRLFGLTPYTVLSGSMEPIYHVGSVIYVSEVDPASLKVGDVITFRLPLGTVVTHGIVDILGENPQSRSFITKGEANDDFDGSPVPADAVIGKAVFSIPFLGYLSEFVRQPAGLLTLGGICLAVLILSFGVDFLTKSEKKTSSDSCDPL
jgi:signal peptidase